MSNPNDAQALLRSFPPAVIAVIETAMSRPFPGAYLSGFQTALEFAHFHPELLEELHKQFAEAFYDRMIPFNRANGEGDVSAETIRGLGQEAADELAEAVIEGRVNAG